MNDINKPKILVVPFHVPSRVFLSLPFGVAYSSSSHKLCNNDFFYPMKPDVFQIGLIVSIRCRYCMFYIYYRTKIDAQYVHHVCVFLCILACFRLLAKTLKCKFLLPHLKRIRQSTRIYQRNLLILFLILVPLLMKSITRNCLKLNPWLPTCLDAIV